MNNSFIGEKEIGNFIKQDNGRESSLFKHGTTLNTPEFNEQNNGLTDLEMSHQTHGHYKEYPYRFLIVVLFCILSFSNAMQWVTFASIAAKFSKEYDIDPLAVDLFSLLYMIVYPFINFPSSYVVDNISLRFGLIFSASFTILAAGLKAISFKGMYLAYIGQTLAAIAQPFILNCPGKISATWFREDRVNI